MADNKKVIFVVTNHDQLGNTGKKTGWYLPELVHPYYVFIENGFEVVFASPKGGKAPLDPQSVQEFKNDAQCKKFLADTSLMRQLDHTVPLAEIGRNVNMYHGLLLVGGHGPMWDLPNCKPLQDIIRRLYEDCKVIVGAICHGPAGLLNVKLNSGKWLVEGKEMTCFSNTEEKLMKLDQEVPFLLEDALREKGAIVKPANPKQLCVRRTERLITGQNPASAQDVGHDMAVAILRNKGRQFLPSE